MWHLLDVAACAKQILAVRSHARRTLAALLQLSQADAVRLAVLLAAFHDLGKFAAPFQRKVDGPPWPFARAKDALYGVSEHDRDGLALWQYRLGAEFASRIWPGAEDTVKRLLGASVGHHGRAVAISSRSPTETFQPEGIAAASTCVAQLIDLLLPAPVRANRPNDAVLGPVSFWFAGFVTIADWAGSGQTYFPYRAPEVPLPDYWAAALQQAKTAVHGLGLVPAKAGPQKSFAALTRQLSPTPLQTLTQNVALGDGPVLVVIEDVTGAGKTEAAQVLVNRLMAADRAAGAYWAMPTQATANAMYERQQHALTALFAAGSRPQLVLAHGGARLHEGFQASVLRSAAAAESNYGDAEPDETASSACAAFLADDARAALIAEVGAGTVDQAVLGVLPARFQAVRLFGLSDKVLVIDEAHAYDAYMSEELRGLLQFHAALGGSAIVLSATLPRDVNKKAGRAQLVRAWMEGAGMRMKEWSGKPVVERTDYPLVTVAGPSAAVHEYPVATAPWSRRRVPVRFVDHDDAVVERLVDAARRGAAVAWIRNTVDDALDAADSIRLHGLKPITFHARFAQSDRQHIEAEVMARLGPGARPDARQGVIVIATQVIEQSLDLDFDLMASDLAPIDLIIQRAGRLRRHATRDASRPNVPFELIVRAPRFEEDPPASWLEGPMRRTTFVYENPAVLWRTMRALRGRGAIETPDALRGLIEEVYGADAFEPTGLNTQAMKAEGIAMAQGGRARQNLLSLAQGYRGEQMAWVGEDRVQVKTRLGAVQTILRLARIADDGRLVPWAQTEGPLWNRWALSEVKVAAYRAPVGSGPIARFAPAAMSARAEWGKREQERDDVLILPLERHDDHWRGTLVPRQGSPVTFAYWQDSGLKIP